MMKENWIEDEILSLPAGEHNYFDRKGSGFLADGGFENDFSKALCAFANSYGGHLIIGVEDDGTITGVPLIHRGRQSNREFLEQKISTLLVPVLQDFRVHEVIPSTPSSIPPERTIIVIDVGDSGLAPHQTQRSNQYFYRSGSNSVNAPHLYLEGLRNRQTFPSPAVVKAWFSNVINPLIEFLESTRKSIESREWRFYDKNFLNSAAHLQSSPTVDEDIISIGYLQRESSVNFSDSHLLQRINAGNKVHFFETYREIAEKASQYDESVIDLGKKCQTLFQNLKTNFALKRKFDELTTREKFLPLLNDKNLLKKANRSEKFEDFLNEYFPPKRMLNDIAFKIVNREMPDKDYSLWKIFWNRNRSHFLQLLNHSSLVDLDRQVNESGHNLLKLTIDLLDFIKRERKYLSERHGIPFYS